LRGVGISAAILAEAKTKALRASELDPEMVQPHGCTAALLSLEWSWKAAEENFQRALRIGSHAATYRQYALFLAVQKRFDESWHYLQKAQHLDPFSHRQKLAWARFFHASRRYHEIDRHFQERLIHGPLPVEARLYLAFTYVELGRLDEARRIAQETRQDSGARPTLAACLAEVLARCGEISLAHELVNSWKLLSAIPGISRFRQALLAIALGDTSGAFSLLSAAYDSREPELIWLSVDPRLDPLRNDPRLTAMIESVMSEGVS
jgi:tetratricopeptide (TPR) repeat protein